MTATELLNEIRPNRTEKYFATLHENNYLDVNLFGFYSQLIKDAARCNQYNANIYYDIKAIEDLRYNFDPKHEPIWIGFRRHGVDGTESILIKRQQYDSAIECLSKEYFAVYSVVFKKSEKYDDYYIIEVNEYYM